MTEGLEFKVPAKDAHVVWPKITGKRAGSVRPGVDSQDGGNWRVVPDAQAEECWQTCDQWGRFDLIPGKHTPDIANKGSLQVLKMFIINDLSVRSDGHVNILTDG